jgi:hypothetical protein
LSEPVWKRYLTDYNEGLGVVYERFVLNEYLDKLLAPGWPSRVAR